MASSAAEQKPSDNLVNQLLAALTSSAADDASPVSSRSTVNVFGSVRSHIAEKSVRYLSISAKIQNKVAKPECIQNLIALRLQPVRLCVLFFTSNGKFLLEAILRVGDLSQRAKSIGGVP